MNAKEKLWQIIQRAISACLNVSIDKIIALRHFYNEYISESQANFILKVLKEELKKYDEL